MDGNLTIPRKLELLLWGLIAVPVMPAVAGAQTAGQVTFARDVAPILQENCVRCHRAGTAAPMTLETYEEARQWAPLIKERVRNRQMPPWPLDQTVGIQRFKNDISLSDDEIATIVRWVDSGAQLGDPADLPEPREWPDWANSWRYEEVFGRPPDAVLTSPPYTVVSDGMDQWPAAFVEVRKDMGIDGERWIRAVEIRPATPDSRYVFHHANARAANRTPEDIQRTQLVPQRNSIQGDQRSYIANFALGAEGEIYPEGTGRLIKEGDLVHFEFHYYPVDRDVEAAMQIGLWLYPENEVPYPSDGWLIMGWRGLAGMEENPLIIPPNSQAVYRGSFVLDGNARLYGFRGHMHMRGKYQMIEVIYPDGRYELLSKLNWDHGWHTQFLYEDDVMPLLPKGTRVILTSVHDNTADNPYNPDPYQWVVGGSRTVDEMHNMRLGVTFFRDEEFQRLVAERERQYDGRAGNSGRDGQIGRQRSDREE